MGRSGSSSQANQSTANAYADNKVANESGIVVGGSGRVDLSDHSQYDLSNRSTNLSSSWDYTDVSDRSSKSAWTDLSNRSTANSWDSSATATGSYNNTNTYSTDQGSVAAAFDFAKGNDATLASGMSSVLTFAKDITNKNSDNATTLASRFGDGVAQAFDSARNTTPGGIDNKTMTVMAVAVAGAVAAYAMSKGR